jgi:hypothetical protein
MIPKIFASVVCLGFCALITFASSVTPDRSRIVAGQGAAPTVETVQPILEPGDRIVVPASRAQIAAFAPPASDVCSDSIANCADPVKHLGTQNDCACFACGYGTATQRSVCTKNAADKDALFKRAR